MPVLSSLEPVDAVAATVRRKPKPKPKAKRKPKAKPRCRVVTKKVKGRKKKVKVCRPKKRKPPVFSGKPSVPPSGARPVAPADPPAPSGDPPAVAPGRLSAAQAERLLWRAGFGPRPGQVAALTGTPIPDAVLAFTRPSGYSLTGPAATTDDGDPLAPLDNYGHDHCAWLDRMVRCDQPLIERMALVWHDWFAVSMSAVGDFRYMADHIQLFRDFGIDNSFDDLLRRVTTDPAMLIFLNGIDNTKNNPNENFAREVMELFSLGAERGAYTETDIREAAKALTGWRATWDDVAGRLVNFRYDPKRHKTGNKTVFGQTGDFGWEDVVRLCVEHPLHASFFCAKLWSYFVHEPPDSATLAALQGVYLGSGRRIRPVLEAILQHPRCLDGETMVLPPVVYTAGLMRGTGRYLTSDDWSWLGDISGQRLFYPPNVAGWDDEKWLDTSTLRGRWYCAQYVLGDLRIDPWPDGGSTYDKTETSSVALDAALAVLGAPAIGAGSRAALLAFGDRVEQRATSNWMKSPYRAMRQNALRMLIATSPDRNVC